MEMGSAARRRAQTRLDALMGCGARANGWPKCLSCYPTFCRFSGSTPQFLRINAGKTTAIAQPERHVCYIMDQEVSIPESGSACGRVKDGSMFL